MSDAPPAALHWAIAAVCALVLVCALSVLVDRRGGPRSHRWRLRSAKKLYGKLRKGQIREEAVLTYLRSIDPFVFEELVLYAFSRCGYRVRRNYRYTGDGGVDGRMKGHGRRWLLQMKRYSGYVNASDVQAFSELCLQKHRNGVFVHTGRTGRASKDEISDAEGVGIVSGSLLVGLLCRGEDPALMRKF